MTHAPFFDDTSLAGYDHDCHTLTCQAAQQWGLDVHDPAQLLQVAQRLGMWLQKLTTHTRQHMPPDHDPLARHPF